MKPIIEVNHLSKKYSIGQKQEYYTLRDTLSNPLKSLRDKKEEFWALKDVSFSVNQGEVLGVIGPNGAGKSTLLKILSRITPPTEGEVIMRGRVASLLEVGTGFHQELTGRENIYLNGSILGMSKKEIDKKFDEIVKFAEIGKFLDTPIKHYSSGMKVKLAFSVAAHLEPEILLIDEVLSVGDVNFQKKSLGKISEITKNQKRTIIFVSHNMAAIDNLCKCSVFIQNGKIKKIGKTPEVVSFYIDRTTFSRDLDTINKKIKNIKQNQYFKLLNIKLKQGQRETTTFQNGSGVKLIINFEVLKSVKDLRIYFDIVNNKNEIIFRSFHNDGDRDKSYFNKGSYKTIANLPKDLFSPSEYKISIGVSIYNQESCLPQNITIPISFNKTGKVCLAYPEDQIRGLISPLINWNTKKIKK